MKPIAHAVRSLRAVRHYLPGEIDPSVLNRWIDAARWCGSSRNGQPWRFIAVDDRDVLAQLAVLGGYTRHLEGCSMALVVASRRDGPEFSRTFDLGRICQSLMLLAAEDGYGSCIGIFEPRDNMRRAAQLVDVPAELEVDLAIAFGLPAPNDREPSVSPPGRLTVPELLAFGSYRQSWPRPSSPAGT